MDKFGRRAAKKVDPNAGQIAKFRAKDIRNEQPEHGAVGGP
jgi:hypothetical protein